MYVPISTQGGSEGNARRFIQTRLHAYSGIPEHHRQQPISIQPNTNSGIAPPVQCRWGLSPEITACFCSVFCLAHTWCYVYFNSENTELPNLSFDLVTIMYGFHEMPLVGRVRILNEARRLLKRGGHLTIVDICPSYKPADAMLEGKPFVLEYQQKIESQLANLKGFRLSKRKSVVPGHVNIWLLTAALAQSPMTLTISRWCMEQLYV